MDFRSMKRRELQALCKKHKIPANLSNVEMAKRLTELFKENENSTVEGLIRGEDENASDSESTDVVVNKKVKKVRFSPEHELIEFTRSREIKRSRRNSILGGNSHSSIENVESGQKNGENVEGHGRVTRSRGLKSMDGQVNERMRGRKGAKCFEQKNSIATIENTDNGELRDVGGLGLRGKKLAEGVKNARKRGKAKEDDKSDKKSLDNVDDEKLIEQIVDGPGRLTRLRCQKLTEVSVEKTKTKRVRTVVEIVDNVPLVSGETDDNRVVTRRSSRKQGVLEKNEVADVHRMIEPQILLRRSKRSASAVGDSQILNDETRKHDNDGIKGSTKSVNLLAADRISKGETDGRVHQIREPIKVEVRGSNRRKDVIASNENVELKAETEYTYQLRSSVPQFVSDGVSKNEKKMPQGTGVIRRSRRKTFLEPAASDKKSHTDAVVENCETAKHLSKENPVEKGISAAQKNTRRSRRNASDHKLLEVIDELGGDSIIQKNNEARKRKRGPISEGDDVKIETDPSSLKQSLAKSRKVETVSIAKADAQLSVSEGVESTSNPRLSSDTINKIISDVEPTSSRKAHGEKEDDSIASSAENRIAELKTDSARSGKHFSASNIQEEAGNVDSLKFDNVQGVVEQNITNMDKNQFENEAQLFSQTKDSSRVNMIDNETLPEGSNVSGNACFAEISSSTDSVLLADLEVTEAEADAPTRPGSDVVDHVGEVEGTSVQENLDSVETGQLNVISSSIACPHNDVDHMDASHSISDNNKEDTASKAGQEVGVSQSCVVSLGKPRSIEGDNADEGEEAYFQKDIVSELAEIEKGECLKDHKIANNEDDGFNVPHLVGCETSVRITPQDEGIISGEYSAMKPDEHGMDKESLAVSPITICPNSTNICVEKDLAAEHTGEGEESCIYKSILPEVANTDECGSPNLHKSKCHEDEGFTMSNIFDVERRDKMMSQDGEILSGKNSVKGFDEKGVEIKLKSGHEANQLVESDEAYVHKDNQSESAEKKEGGCFKIHMNIHDEDWLFSVSKLFDGEKSDRRTPQDGGTLSVENSIKDFNEQAAFYDFPAVSTMCTEVTISADSSSLKEISPSKPSSPSKCQGTTSIISDACEIIDNEAGGAAIPEKEDDIVQNNIPGDDEMSMKKKVSDGDHKIFNQADEQTIKYTPKQAEQPKSPSAKQPKSPSAVASAITNNIQGQEAFTGASETMRTSQTNSEGITNPIVEGSNTDEDGIDANCSKDDFGDASITGADISMNYSISKLGAESFCDLVFHHTEDSEYQSKNLHEKHAVPDVGQKPKSLESSQSWTEIELRNLFETTMHDVTVTGLNDTTTSQGTEVASVMCMNKSDTNSGNSLTNKKKKEIEGERESKSAKTTYMKALSPTNCKQVSDSDPGSGAECEEKIDSRSIVDETSSHEKTLDRTDVLITECVGTTKENTVAQKSDEKVRVAVNELRSSLCLGSSSDNGEEINYDELNAVGSAELMKTSTIVLSEASEEHLTENPCECLKKSDAVTEENGEEKISPLGQCCLHAEATDRDCELTEKNTISSSGSLRNSDKLEDGQEMLIDTDLSGNFSFENKVCLKSEKNVAQSNEAAFELSDANTQKSNVIENSHHRTAYYEDNNLSEMLSETSKGPVAAEVTNIGSFNDTSPSRFSKASNDDDEVKERKTGDDADLYEAKTWDEKDDNSRLHDISNEPDCNIEVAILKSPSVCNTQLHSACSGRSTIIQNVDNMVAAAGVNDNDASDTSESGSPINNSEGDHEKNSKDVEENLSATNVRISINSNNDVQSISDEATDNENGDIEKSEVGAPLLEGGHVKNDTDVEENSTAMIAQFPISEIHLEEKVIDSKNDVPAFGCNEFLKESDVADTIKEYIDSELARMNEMTTCENAATCESIESIGTESNKGLEETVYVNLHVGGYTADKSLSVETKSEEQMEEMLFEESLTGPKTVVNSSAIVDLIGDSGSGVNDAMLPHKEEAIESVDGGPGSSSRLLCSAMKKNTRTILIHGTPRKILTTADMKENAPTHKRSNIGDFTTVRPVKRKALQDVQWK